MVQKPGRRAWGDVVTISCEPQGTSKYTDGYDCDVIHIPEDGDRGDREQVEVEGFAVKDGADLRAVSEDHTVVGGGSSYRNRDIETTIYFEKEDCTIDPVERLVCGV